MNDAAIDSIYTFTHIKEYGTEMKFCCECGNPVKKEVPQGDNRFRHVCTHCEIIHYQNPKIVAGTIPIFEGKILLCRRAIEPRLGYWTLPAGFMENQETTSEAALRTGPRAV